jgi:hypothetical protein
MFPLNDEHYENKQLTEVTGDAESGWTLHFDSMCLGCPGTSDEGQAVRPEVGMTVRTYGRGFGYPVRGLYLNEQRVYYRTEAEEEQRHQDWCADEKRKRREAFEAHREERDAKVAALPAIFQRRIQKFRDKNPEFRYEYEPYEVFCCEQAVLFARKFPTTEQLQAFAKADWKDQVAHFEGEEKEAFEGHSGNTFGMSVRLAYHYLANPENVYREHGALVALVGCEAYGCPHEPEKTLAQMVEEAGEEIAERLLNGTDTGEGQPK